MIRIKTFVNLLRAAAAEVEGAKPVRTGVTLLAAVDKFCERLQNLPPSWLVDVECENPICAVVCDARKVEKYYVEVNLDPVNWRFNVAANIVEEIDAFAQSKVRRLG